MVMRYTIGLDNLINKNGTNSLVATFFLLSSSDAGIKAQSVKPRPSVLRFTGLNTLVQATNFSPSLKHLKFLRTLGLENVRKNSYSIHQLHAHLVSSTKYRYEALRGDVQIRCRELIRQSCDRLDIQILKGVVSKDHIHLHLSYPPKLSISEILKRFKGRSEKILLIEYSELKKRYWGGYFWVIGYGAWSTGNITDEMIQHYPDHHRNGPNSDQNLILMKLSVMFQ